MSSIMNVLLSRHIRTFSIANINHKIIWRHYADTTTIDPTKQVVKPGTFITHNNLSWFRVRRARVSDGSNIIRFIRENAPLAWPGVKDPPAIHKNSLLTDFVSRTLCQGHSMVAEQVDVKYGLSHLRGLALNTSVCPWDAMMLEKWAQCVKCAHIKELMQFSAHCLRAPGLHDKYQVRKILQIVLMVPPETPKASQITQVLAKASIQRGRALGYPVVRFDVTSDHINKVVNDLKLTKEWEANLEVHLPSMNSEFEKSRKKSKDKNNSQKNIVVYTAFPQREQK